MICYKDMQFCARKECANYECERNIAWVPDDCDLPVAQADMKTEECGFVPTQQQTQED